MAVIDKLLVARMLKDASDEEVWRTSEEGRHFKFENETGEIRAGFGGKFNGQTLRPKKNPEVFSGKNAGKSTGQSSGQSAGKARYSGAEAEAYEMAKSYIKGNGIPTVFAGTPKQRQAIYGAVGEFGTLEPEEQEIYRRIKDYDDEDGRRIYYQGKNVKVDGYTETEIDGAKKVLAKTYANEMKRRKQNGE